MAMAIEASKRSCDANTRVGSLIVNPFNQIIGTGYNSFPRGFPDNILPNTRDKTGAKYPWIVHAEVNSIINLTQSPFVYPDGVTVYCTLKPCIPCLGMLINANVKTIYFLAAPNRPINELENKIFWDMINYGKVICKEVSI